MSTTFLIEDGSVGAEEAVLDEAPGVAVHAAHVEGLALGLHVRVVSALRPVWAVTAEAGLGDLRIDRVVLAIAPITPHTLSVSGSHLSRVAGD